MVICSMCVLLSLVVIYFNWKGFNAPDVNNLDRDHCRGMIVVGVLGLLIVPLFLLTGLKAFGIIIGIFSLLAAFIGSFVIIMVLTEVLGCTDTGDIVTTLLGRSLTTIDRVIISVVVIALFVSLSFSALLISISTLGFIALACGVIEDVNPEYLPKKLQKILSN